MVVANEMGRGGVSMAVTFANSSAASLPGMPYGTKCAVLAAFEMLQTGCS